MMALAYQFVDDLPAGIVRIRKKVVGPVNGEGTQKSGHFIEQRACIPIGEEYAFMDSACEWHSEYTLCRFDEQSNRLE